LWQTPAGGDHRTQTGNSEQTKHDEIPYHEPVNEARGVIICSCDQRNESNCYQKMTFIMEVKGGRARKPHHHREAIPLLRVSTGCPLPPYVTSPDQVSLPDQMATSAIDETGSAELPNAAG
jgi:hypothetical protein